MRPIFENLEAPARAATRLAVRGGAILLACASLAAVLPAGPAAAQQVKQFRDWSLYTHQDKDGRLCYIVSVPKKSEGTYKQRGEAAAFVSRLPTQPPKEEVSLQPGYAFKAGSEVEITVDGADKFSLFTQGEHAWARTPKDDQAVIAAMGKGQAMIVKGTSSRDTTSTDTFSLLGFSAAYKAMIETCKGAKPAAAKPVARG